MLTLRTNRWDPFSQFRDEMSRLVDDFTRGGLLFDRWALRQTNAFPAMNVWEDEHNLYAEAELPGFRLDDLEIFVVGNELTIKGERKEQHGEKAAYHRRERRLEAFHRMLRLPVDIATERVEAMLKDGVLNLTLPKAEKAKPRKIAVKALTQEAQ